jgi:hypothetical protein
MNSIYGVLSSRYGELSFKAIGATVTATGRNMLLASKEYTEKHYKNSRVVYGDSVSGRTPVLVKNVDTGIISIKRIDSIFGVNLDIWEQYENFKPFDSVSSNRTDKMCFRVPYRRYQIWSKTGWNYINKIIKHKCNKKLLKVSTDLGVVEVTEDHSLIDGSGCKIKPKDCILNKTELFHNYPYFKEGMYKGYSIITMLDDIENDYENLTTDEMLSYLFGFHYYFLHIDDKDLETLCSDNSRALIYLIKCRDSKRESLSELDEHSVFFEKLLRSSDSVKYQFLLGYFTLYRSNTGIMTSIEIDLSGDTEWTYSAYIYYISKSLGFAVSITDCGNKMVIDDFGLNGCGKVINSMDICSNKGQYVYDVETEDHTFQAGIGELCVFNTDSIFVKFETKSTKDYIESIEKGEENLELKNLIMEEAFEMGKIASKDITNTIFKSPIKLEFEKVYCPLILLQKKTYIGKYYGTSPIKHDYIDCKGVVTQKRDRPQLLKRVYTQVRDYVMEHNRKGVKLSIEFIKDEVMKLRTNKYDMNDLIITKKLKENYKNQNLPHVALRNKIALRDKFSAPKSNEYISFVYTLTDNKKDPLYKRTELPEYVIEHNLKVDVEYYIKNQLAKSITQLLELFNVNAKVLFE